MMSLLRMSNTVWFFENDLEEFIYLETKRLFPEHHNHMHVSLFSHHFDKLQNYGEADLKQLRFYFYNSQVLKIC